MDLVRGLKHPCRQIGVEGVVSYSARVRGLKHVFKYTGRP